MTDLGRVLPILGPSWDVVYSDWIDDAGGDKEGAVFVFDSRAVTFNGLVAEVDTSRGTNGTKYFQIVRDGKKTKSKVPNSSTTDG